MRRAGPLWGGFAFEFTGATGGNVVTANTGNGLSLGTAMDFGGGNRTINVGDAMGTCDLTISGVLSDGGFTKAGNGALRLTASVASTYTGLTTVNGGVLYLDNTGGVAIPGSLTNNGIANFNANWTGGVNLTNNASLSSGFAQSISLSGTILNTGNITLAGSTLASSIGTTALTNAGNLAGYGTISDAAGQLVNSNYISIAGGTLALQLLSVTNAGNIDIQSTGQLSLACPMTNAGAINLYASSITTSNNSTLTNQGLIDGRGTIFTPLISTGTVQPENGALNITNLFTNQGIIEMTSGSSLLGQNYQCQYDRRRWYDYQCRRKYGYY